VTWSKIAGLFPPIQDEADHTNDHGNPYTTKNPLGVFDDELLHCFSKLTMFIWIGTKTQTPQYLPYKTPLEIMINR
jgi:hypothetical protein